MYINIALQIENANFEKLCFIAQELRVPSFLQTWLWDTCDPKIA